MTRRSVLTVSVAAAAVAMGLGAMAGVGQTASGRIAPPPDTQQVAQHIGGAEAAGFFKEA